VGQGHALPGSWASPFPIRNKPRPIRRLHKRDQKTAGRAWPCPTRGPVPELGKTKWHWVDNLRAIGKSAQTAQVDVYLQRARLRPVG
jgi:hypothetical protein